VVINELENFCAETLHAIQNKSLLNLHSLLSLIPSVILLSPNIFRKIESKKERWAGHVTSIRQKINAYTALVEKAEGKKPLGRPRRRLNYDTKIDLIASRDSGVGIATSYGLDGRRIGVRVPVGSRIFSSPSRPDRL
jgi:hypothetical protein